MENSSGDFPNRLTPVNKSEIRHWSGKSGNSEKVFRIKAEIGPENPPLLEGGLNGPNRNQPTPQPHDPMTISQHLEAQATQRTAERINPPMQHLTPRGCYSITEAAAHSMIAGEVLRWLDQIPHYYDTEDYLDRHDLDRVLEVIRRLGRRGLLKLDNAVGVNAD